MQVFERYLLRVLLASLIAIQFAPPRSSLGQAPLFRIHPLGFLDAAHTHPELGFEFSSVDVAMSGNGIVGTSDQFQGPGGADSGRSAWYFDVATQELMRVGIFDATHTASVGNDQNSRATGLNANGHGTGWSQRYDGDSTSGLSAWVFDRNNGLSVPVGLYDPNSGGPFADLRLRETPQLVNTHGDVAGEANLPGGGPNYAWFYDSAMSATQQIGLVGAEFDDLLNGSHQSDVQFLAPSRHVFGTSDRLGVPSGGRAAWQFDAQTGTTSRIGFFDATHTRADGQQFSEPKFVNDSGLVTGTSEFPRDGNHGHSGWVHDPITQQTHRAGLADAQASDPAAFLLDIPLSITNSGRLLGHTLRYISGYEHKTPWVYDHNSTQTTPLGLFDAEHTRADGGTTNGILHFTDDFVVGEAMRWEGEIKAKGNSVWWHDISNDRTERIGLFDSNYTASSGQRRSVVSALNGAGTVAGYSTRYQGSSILRETPWIFDPVADQTIPFGEGLWFALDSVFNRPVAMNQQGEVAGTSANGPIGQLAWYYSPVAAGQEELVLIGLTDERHQRLTPFGTFTVDSTIGGINETGDVIGFSARFDIGGSAPRGQSAWFFDPEAALIYPLVFSESPSGAAFTNISYLGDDGSVIGEYDYYDASGALEGRRAFYWSPEIGVQDFESLIVGGLPAAGWESLQADLAMVDSRTFHGRGLRMGGGDMPFALVADSDIELPQVIQVLFGSSTWRPAFKDVLGSTAGFYAIPTDADQLKSLPWSIDEVRVVFSEDVSVVQDDLEVFNAGPNQVEVQAFEYVSATHTATWRIDPITADNLLLVVSDDVTSTSTGLRLDGEYITGSGLPASGDGTPGGEFFFRFDVLAGNGGQDGTNSLDDLQLLAADWGQQTNASNLFNDFDGSGQISLSDLQILAINWGATLPLANPALSPETSAVPEPSSLLLAIAALILAARDRRESEAGHRGL